MSILFKDHYTGIVGNITATIFNNYLISIYNKINKKYKNYIHKSLNKYNPIRFIISLAKPLKDITFNWAV